VKDVNDLIDVPRTVAVLNEIVKAELSGVVRYTHYSLVITGPNRIPLVTFMQAQASESLLHAQQAGSVYLEEFARTQIGAEEMHMLQMNKLLRDYTIG
jgi:bacterioferritin (cytochrome b1)